MGAPPSTYAVPSSILKELGTLNKKNLRFLFVEVKVHE